MFVGVGELNTGGGVKLRPGFFGRTMGGRVGEGVKPNCPAAKFCVPAGLVTLMSPSMTCTYRPVGSEDWAGFALGLTPLGTGICAMAAAP